MVVPSDWLPIFPFRSAVRRRGRLVNVSWNFWRHFDFWLLGAVVLAIAFGVAMIRSAIAGNEEIAQSVTRQIQFAWSAWL